MLEIQTVKQDGTVILHEEELDKNVEIVLQETDTMWIYDMRPTIFNIESEGSAEIQNRNKLYETVRLLDYCKL